MQVTKLELLVQKLHNLVPSDGLTGTRPAQQRPGNDTAGGMDGTHVPNACLLRNLTGRRQTVSPAGTLGPLKLGGYWLCWRKTSEVRSLPSHSGLPNWSSREAERHACVAARPGYSQ